MSVIREQEEKVSYRKQISRQHLCYKKFWPELGASCHPFDRRAKFRCYVSCRVGACVGGRKN